MLVGIVNNVQSKVGGGRKKGKNYACLYVHERPDKVVCSTMEIWLKNGKVLLLDKDFEDSLCMNARGKRSLPSFGLVTFVGLMPSSILRSQSSTYRSRCM
jgi:hypothetical protein